jgi:hypothetical protein
LGPLPFNRPERSATDEEFTLTMFPNFAIGALALGALLVLTALAPRLRGGARSGRSATWSVVAAVAGAVLLGWGLLSSLGSRSPSRPAPPVTPTRAPSPVDLVEVAGAALQACPRATAPAVPDGGTASREEMAAATAAFKSFDTATKSYVHCVDVTIERIASQHPEASQDDLHSLKEFGRVAHNTAIDQETAVADELNSEVRSYKAKHPQS